MSISQCQLSNHRAGQFMILFLSPFGQSQVTFHDGLSSPLPSLELKNPTKVQLCLSQFQLTWSTLQPLATETICPCHRHKQFHQSSSPTTFSATIPMPPSEADKKFGAHLCYLGIEINSGELYSGLPSAQSCLVLSSLQQGYFQSKNMTGSETTLFSMLSKQNLTRKAYPPDLGPKEKLNKLITCLFYLFLPSCLHNPWELEGLALVSPPSTV